MEKIYDWLGNEIKEGQEIYIVKTKKNGYSTFILGSSLNVAKEYDDLVFYENVQYNGKMFKNYIKRHNEKSPHLIKGANRILAIKDISDKK